MVKDTFTDALISLQKYYQEYYKESYTQSTDDYSYYEKTTIPDRTPHSHAIKQLKETSPQTCVLLTHFLNRFGETKNFKDRMRIVNRFLELLKQLGKESTENETLNVFIKDKLIPSLIEPQHERQARFRLDKMISQLEHLGTNNIKTIQLILNDQEASNVSNFKLTRSLELLTPIIDLEKYGMQINKKDPTIGEATVTIAKTMRQAIETNLHDEKSTDADLRNALEDIINKYRPEAQQRRNSFWPEFFKWLEKIQHNIAAIFGRRIFQTTREKKIERIADEVKTIQGPIPTELNKIGHSYKCLFSDGSSDNQTKYQKKASESLLTLNEHCPEMAQLLNSFLKKYINTSAFWKMEWGYNTWEYRRKQMQGFWALLILLQKAPLKDPSLLNRLNSRHVQEHPSQYVTQLSQLGVDNLDVVLLVLDEHSPQNAIAKFKLEKASNQLGVVNELKKHGDTGILAAEEMRKVILAHSLDGKDDDRQLIDNLIIIWNTYYEKAQSENKEPLSIELFAAIASKINPCLQYEEQLKSEIRFIRGIQS